MDLNAILAVMQAIGQNVQKGQANTPEPVNPGGPNLGTANQFDAQSLAKQMQDISQKIGELEKRLPKQEEKKSEEAPTEEVTPTPEKPAGKEEEPAFNFEVILDAIRKVF